MQPPEDSPRNPLSRPRSPHPCGRSWRRHAEEDRLPGARDGHLRGRLRRCRAGGAHQGNDIMAPKRSARGRGRGGQGRVRATVRERRLHALPHGQSGTDYFYIHLNNDLHAQERQPRQVRRGDVAYAKGLKDGAKVVAGQPVGYVGDSGDANGIHPHLHFELHPGRQGRGRPVPVAPARVAAAVLRTEGRTLHARAPRDRGRRDRGSAADPARRSERVAERQRQSKLKRRVLVNVPADATVQRVPKLGARGTAMILTARRSASSSTSGRPPRRRRSGPSAATTSR